MISCGAAAGVADYVGCRSRYCSPPSSRLADLEIDQLHQSSGPIQTQAGNSHIPSDMPTTPDGFPTHAQRLRAAGERYHGQLPETHASAAWTAIATRQRRLRRGLRKRFAEQMLKPTSDMAVTASRSAHCCRRPCRPRATGPPPVLPRHPSTAVSRTTPNRQPVRTRHPSTTANRTTLIRPNRRPVRTYHPSTTVSRLTLIRLIRLIRALPDPEPGDGSRAWTTSLSPASLMGPSNLDFCHEDGTTRLPVMGPPSVSRWRG